MTAECPHCLEPAVPLVDDVCHCAVCDHEWTPDEEPREQADGYSSFDGCREGASWAAERDRRAKGETGGHW